VLRSWLVAAPRLLLVQAPVARQSDGPLRSRRRCAVAVGFNFAQLFNFRRKFLFPFTSLASFFLCLAPVGLYRRHALML